MPKIITSKLKIDNAKNFIDRFNDTNNTLYFFLGKPSAWPDETTPLPLNDYSYDNGKVWDEMVSLKRVLPTSIANVVRRINWGKNTVYSPYDDQDIDLFSKEFYVLNSENNVYKCISNFSGSMSLVEPTGTSKDITTLSDGYRWKYLYSIGIGDSLKFLTSKWMPVFKNIDVANAAIGGAIEHIKIINSGANYPRTTTINIFGDGINASFVPKINLGVIYDFFYINVGNDYRYAIARVDDTSNVGNYANIIPIVSPYKGHGFDPVEELNANKIMINVKTDYNEGFGDFPGQFSYRTFGILNNPKRLDGSFASNTTLSALQGIYVRSCSNVFSQYEYIEGSVSSANAFIITSNINSGNGYTKFIQTFDKTNFNNFIPGEVVIGKTSGTTAIVSNLLYPEVLKNEGSIFYIENRTPITRSKDQTDNLHLVIEF